MNRKIIEQFFVIMDAKIFKKKLKKYLAFFFVSLLIISVLKFFQSSIFAETKIKTRIDWRADEELTNPEKDQFGNIEKIFVVGLTSKDKEVRINTDYWIKGLFYFFNTKTRFSDMPFNYLVGWDGQIFEGRTARRDLIAPIYGQNALLIGYLSNYETVETTTLGRDALSELLVNLVNENNVSPSNIIVADWKITPTDNLQESNIEILNSSNSLLLKNTVAEILPDIKNSFSPQKQNYSAEILSIDAPSEMSINSTYSVTIKIKNTGDANWYKDSYSEITISTENGEDSSFNVPDEWISSSQAKAMEQDIVTPQEEIDLKLNVFAPFAFGEYSEKFVLKTVGGDVISGTSFEIKANIDTAGQTIAQVKETPTGYLNVRNAPRPSGALITQILPGEKFIVLETQSSWYKIKLRDGQEGWATGQYLRVL